MVARIASVGPVPGSSHLQFADLDLGGEVPAALAAFSVDPGTVRVLTGAPNVKVGDLVPYAPPGTRPPAMDERLGVKTIRGHKSPGMLCSAIELGVGEDADGILILDEGTPGQALARGADPRHRPRPRGHHQPAGLPLPRRHRARARRRARRGARPSPRRSVPDELLSATSAELRAQVRIEDPEGCPRFAARVIEGVAVGPSPAWLRQRLRAVGLRPINNVVDVTNFVLHELGQPLHAFDLDRFVDAGGDKIADVVVAPGRARRARRRPPRRRPRAVGAEDLVVCAGDDAGQHRRRHRRAVPPRSPTRPGPCCSRRRPGTGRRSGRPRSGSASAPTRRRCSRRG